MRGSAARAGAAAGIAGPAAFTGAWIAGSLRQTGHPAAEIQISGLAAPDARDPLRRDHMLLTSGSVSWHNHAHDVTIAQAAIAAVAVRLLRTPVRSGPP